MAKIRVGRSSSNEVVLKDTTVSRSHAEIEEIGGGQYRVTDVGSSAGTFLKKGDTWSQITSAEVGANAEVRFGEAEVKLSDIISSDPATEAPRAASGLGQRAEKGAVEQSRQGAGGGGAGAGQAGGGGAGGGSGASGGGGWSNLPPNYKIGVIVGGGVFALLIVVAIIIGMLGGEGGTTAGGGTITGGRTTVGGGGSTGTGTTGGSVSGNAAKARLEIVMKTSCTKRGRNDKVCRCIAKNIVAGISDSDAEAIVNAQRGGGKPPQAAMRKFLAAAFAAGRTCAKSAG